MRALQLLSGGIYAILWHRLTLINNGSVKLPSKILDAYSIVFAKLVFLVFMLIFIVLSVSVAISAVGILRLDAPVWVFHGSAGGHSWVTPSLNPHIGLSTMSVGRYSGISRGDCEHNLCGKNCKAQA